MTNNDGIVGASDRNDGSYLTIKDCTSLGIVFGGYVYTIVFGFDKFKKWMGMFAKSIRNNTFSGGAWGLPLLAENELESFCSSGVR